MDNTSVSPLEHKNIRILGRSDGVAPLQLFWTGSGVELDLRGSYLYATFEADFERLEPWICVLINGHMVLRRPLDRGTNEIQIFHGLNPENLHNIRILRESQPMPDDSRTCVKLHSLRFDGSLAPLPPSTCKIEFLGDSLSSAEGSLGGPLDQEWLPIWFSAHSGYAYLTACALGGEAHILTQSGWGVRSSWDNDPKCALPKYYEQVCGVLPAGHKGAGSSAYDFSSWKADAIVCALGTNDRGAINQPARFDPESGSMFKQTMETLPALEDDMLAFLHKLRKCNPDAKIIWMFFEGDTVILPVIRRAMDRFHAQGDQNSTVIAVPPMQPTGARNHPGADEHQRTASALALELSKLLGLPLLTD